MAVIGTATLNIVPKVQGGLAKTINGEIRKADLSGLGRAAGGSFMGGLTSGAAFGIWSTVASKAINTVSASMSSAVSRVDTLNNFTPIMKSLGVAEKEADASMQKMSSSLDNVPTRLDDMASTVQGLYAATMKYGVGLDTVTDAGLALNGMLLAGGQGQQVVNSAMEQFRQMVSKGKPDLQDWRALISAAPGQMEQLAKAMLGTTATADDLYAALGGGKESDYDGPFEWGSLGMDEFVKKFAGLKEKFAGAAEEANAGISTSLANMRNAVTKGVANVINAFGRERIAGAIGDVKGMINDVFGRKDTEGMRAFAAEVAPGISASWEALKGAAGELSPAVERVSSALGKLAVGGVASLPGLIGAAAEPAARIADAFSDIAVRGIEALGPFAEKVGPSLVGVLESAAGVAEAFEPTIGRIVDRIGELAGPAVSGVLDGVSRVLEGVGEAWTDFRQWDDGVTGARDFASAIGGISGPVEATQGTVGVFGDKVVAALAKARDAASDAEEAHGRYLEQLRKSADVVVGANDTYQTQTSRLEYLGSVMDNYAGKSGLSASQQAELSAAVAEVNELCGTQYSVMEDGCTIVNEETGEVQDNTEAIWDNIRAREAQAKADAIGTAKVETDNLRAAAANDFAAQERSMRSADKALQGMVERYGSLAAVRAKANEKDVMGNMTHEAAEAAYVLSVWEAAASSMQEADGNQRHLAQSSAELAAEQAALSRMASGAELTLEDLALTSDVAMQAFNDGGGKAEQSIVDFAAAIQACATDSAALKKAMDDPDTMARIVAAYDGTASSLTGVFDEIHVGWNASKAEMIDSQGTISQMGDWLADLGTTAYGSMSSMGESADSMAVKLADAGVSMQDLSRVGEQDFGTMLEKCGGDMDQLVGAIQLYNQQGVEDKDGSISVDQVPLVDALGNVYTWNGKNLVDKETGVAVKGRKELLDAYGNVLDWNGRELKSKSAKVSTDQGNLPDVLRNVQTFMNLPSIISKETKLTNTTRNVTITEARTATGPAKLNAATGGHIVPRHASGYIAAGATRTNFGWVGEDGIEAVYNNDDGTTDVYPLNNPRYLAYADPLGERIAKSVMGAMGGGGRPSYVINGLTYLPGSAIEGHVEAIFDEALRMGRMG